MLLRNIPVLDIETDVWRCGLMYFFKPVAPLLCVRPQVSFMTAPHERSAAAIYCRSIA